MKKKLGQRRHQSGGSAVSCGIGDPKQSSSVAHAQPAVDVATDLNDRTIDRSDFPTRKRRRILRNQRLLRQPRRFQIAFQISAPCFQLVILLFDLAPHFAQSQLRVDTRRQHRDVNRLGDKIVGARFETKHFAHFTAVAREHDGRNLRDRRIFVRAQFF